MAIMLGAHHWVYCSAVCGVLKGYRSASPRFFFGNIIGVLYRGGKKQMVTMWNGF